MFSYFSISVFTNPITLVFYVDIFTSYLLAIFFNYCAPIY
jgi:hypothetical protein